MDYSELDSEHEIRILCVRSRSFSTIESSVQLLDDVPIHCDLRTVRRVDKPDYDALSYAWGNENTTLPILVKHTGKSTEYTKVQVTVNLCHALRHLRDDNLDVILWVDSLCINQKNIKEKDAQVERMRDVYAHARRTRVWLGSGDSKSDKAIIKLTGIGKDVTDRGAFGLMLKMSRLSTKNPVEAYEAEMRARELVGDMFKRSATEQAESYDLLTELGKILSRPYWERVWILQEIVISPKVEVYCGRSKIDLVLLHAALLYIIYMQIYISEDLFGKLNTALDDASKAGVVDPDYDPELLRQFEEIGSVSIPESAKLVFGMCSGYQSPLKETDNISDSITLDLIQLLMKIRVGRKATDARDRIFALLGMARDKENLGIMTSYAETNTCVRLYCETARAIIASPQVDLLSFSQPGNGEGEFPSWVPNWQKDIMEPFGLLPWHTPYISCGEKDLGKFRKHPKFDNAPINHLMLYGYRIDTVDSLKDQCNKGEYLEMKDRQAAWNYIKDIKTLCDQSNEKLKQTGEEIYSDVLARTLAPQIIPIAGMFVKGFFRGATIGECKTGWEEVINDCIGWSNGNPLPEKTTTMISYYNMMAHQVSRRPFATQKGFVGLAPSHVQKGDVVVIFQGAKFPYTLRRNSNGTYRLVGETYLHGVMYGEFLKPGMITEEFCLV